MPLTWASHDEEEVKRGGHEMRYSNKLKISRKFVLEVW